MKKRNILFICILILLTSCSPQTNVTDEVSFVGEGKYWHAKYIYNAELYDEKYTNWIEMAYKGDDKSEFDINDIDIKLKGKDGTVTGNLGEMKTKVDKNTNTISFLIGTVNFETYKEDIYTLSIRFKKKQDIIKLKAVN